MECREVGDRALDRFDVDDTISLESSATTTDTFPDCDAVFHTQQGDVSCQLRNVRHVLCALSV